MSGFYGIDGDRVPRRRKRPRPSRVNRANLIQEQTLGVKTKAKRRSARISDYYKADGVTEDVQTIQDIGDKTFASKLKKEWEGDLTGSLYGGALGVAVALVTKNNPYTFGIVGLIGGRILYKK